MLLVGVGVVEERGKTDGTENTLRVIHVATNGDDVAAAEAAKC